MGLMKLNPNGPNGRSSDDEEANEDRVSPVLNDLSLVSDEENIVDIPTSTNKD